MNSTNQSLSSPQVLCFRWHSIIHDDYVVSDYLFTVLATIANLLTCPIIVFLKGLVITAITTKRRLQTMHNILLACLAVPDLVMGVAAQPVFITLEMMVLVGGSSSLACTFYNLTRVTILSLCLVSYLYVAVISVERFVAIKFPYRYDTIVTKFRLTVAIATCWLIIMVYFILDVLKIRVFPRFIIIYGSFFVMIFCHTYVYFTCRRHEIQIQSEQVSQEAAAKFLKEKKACKTTSIIIGGVFICYFPGFVVSTLPMIFPGIPVIRRLCVSSRPLFFTFYILNSLCNPVIYCWRSTEIPEASKQLLKKPANGGPN